MYEELYHHGVKGQQWGERNGPPYPLDSKGSSLRKQKRIYKKMNKKLNALDKSKKSLDEKIEKKAEKIGASDSDVKVYKKYFNLSYDLMKKSLKEAYTLEMKSVNDATIKKGEEYINSASLRKIDSSAYMYMMYKTAEPFAKNEISNNLYEKYYKE